MKCCNAYLQWLISRGIHLLSCYWSLKVYYLSIIHLVHGFEPFKNVDILGIETPWKSTFIFIFLYKCDSNIFLIGITMWKDEHGGTNGGLAKKYCTKGKWFKNQGKKGPKDHQKLDKFIIYTWGSIPNSNTLMVIEMWK